MIREERERRRRSEAGRARGMAAPSAPPSDEALQIFARARARSRDREQHAELHRGEEREARLAEPRDGRERRDGHERAATRARGVVAGPRDLEREARQEEPVAEALALGLVPVEVERGTAPARTTHAARGPRRALEPARRAARATRPGKQRARRSRTRARRRRARARGSDARRPPPSARNTMWMR